MKILLFLLSITLISCQQTYWRAKELDPLGNAKMGVCVVHINSSYYRVADTVKLSDGTYVLLEEVTNKSSK